ncbi:hypothetical protein ACKWTF_003848 [Chironomus riparius]
MTTTFPDTNNSCSTDLSKSRGVIICTFEKFKFEKNRYNFNDFIGVFDCFKKEKAILCLSLTTTQKLHLDFIQNLFNLSFYFFVNFENFELQGMKLRILIGRQTNKTFSQVFLETVTVETLELFVSGPSIISQNILRNSSKNHDK